MARRRRRRSVRRRAASAAPRRRRRSRRVYRVKARLHGLKRHTSYRTNPRRRHRRRRSNPFKLGGGLLGGIPSIKVLGLVAAGAALSAVLLKKLKIEDKLPSLKDASGKPSITGVVAQSAVGAILIGFVVGKLLKKPELGKQLALGAMAVPIGAFLLNTEGVQKQLAGDYDFADDVSGGEYSMPISGGEYSMPQIGDGGDEGPDFGDM